ncbi:flavoprotein [Hortaea werneckii]|nr:flavoprotein [Hortaea werneckii]
MDYLMGFSDTVKALEEVLPKALRIALFLGVLTLIQTIAQVFKRHYSRLIKLFAGKHDPPHPDTSSPTQRNLSRSFRAADHVNDNKHHLLLAATGSVATIKIPNIVGALAKYDNVSIIILLTESSCNFLQGQSGEQPSLAQIANMKNVDGIYRDEDEWRKPWVRGDSILHIELRRWADLMVIAPLSANCLAKMAQGLSDNLVMSVIRAWDATGMLDPARPGVALPYSGKKGIMVAPAMNTAMWHHPLTAEHMKRLNSDWAISNGGWIEVLDPIQKEIACGDTGAGGMHEWKSIVASIERRLRLLSTKEGLE